MKNCLLLFLSVLIGACFAEIAVRYSWVPMTGINISRTEFSARGYLLNPNSGTGNLKIGKQNITCNYYWPHLRDTPFNQQDNNVLVLGDSFTFGWLLPWSKTYVNQIQNKFDNQLGKNKYHFLNAAIGGWGLADYLAYLEEFGDKINPNYVVVFLNTDDIGRAIKRNLYTLDSHDSKKLNSNYHPMKWVTLRKFLFNNWLYEHSMLLQFIRNNLSLTHLIQVKNDKKIHSTFQIPMTLDLSFEDTFAKEYGQAIFLRMQEWCQSHHAKLLVVTTGFNAFYPANIHEPTQAFLASANDFFKQEKIAYYDMASAFQEMVKDKDFLIPIDNHPNELGATAIAQLSGSWLAKEIPQL